MFLERKNSEDRHLELRVSQHLLDRAYEKAVAIFADSDLTPPRVRSHLSIELNGGKFVLDIKRDVVPGIAFALSYFGDSFPATLIQKLRNKPQTQDTLFELLCLGFFAGHNKVVYEPKLTDGKVPDLLVELDGGPPIFVECKSHRFAEAPYFEAFNGVSSQVCQAFTAQLITKAGEQERLRLEVYLKARPSSKEIEAVRKAIPTLTLEQIHREHMLSPSVSLIAVPRSQPLRSGFSLMSGRQVASVEPTKLTMEESSVLVYSWPGLDRQRRKLQRALLKDARLQLRNIPAGSFGMICIQTVSAKRFLPDLHELIDQGQFSRIPIIWLGPSLMPCTESKIVFRDEAGHLLEKLLPSKVRRGQASEQRETAQAGLL